MAQADGERLDVRLLKEAFGEAILSVQEKRGDTYICVERDRIADILRFLKDTPELDYSYFSECVGIDYLGWIHDRDLEERFEVVYNVMAPTHQSRLLIKVGADLGVKVPTAKNVYLGAEYPEREIWDLLGVEFAGNEQTERFLLPEDWIGHPLRKDEPLGGEDVVFHEGTEGPAVEDVSMPHAGESFDGKTGSGRVGGR